MQSNMIYILLAKALNAYAKLELILALLENK